MGNKNKNRKENRKMGIFERLEKALKRNDPSFWNDWIKTQRERKQEFSPNITKKFLDKKDFRGLILTKINFSKSSFKIAIFIDIDLTGSKFREANLYKANFKKANLEETNFFGASCQQAIFAEAKFFGASLQNCDLKRTNFVEADFILADCTSAQFLNANLMNALFTETNICGTNFKDAILIGATFQDISVNQATSFENANLQKAVFEARANLENVSFAQADLTQVSLKGAILKSANFSNTNLMDANLIGADLRWSNLSKTHALGTNFSHSDLTGACIEDWNINDKTNFDEVKCDYIYRRSNQQQRAPKNGNFRSGEFTKIIEEMLYIIDIKFDGEIDIILFIESLEKTKDKLKLQCDNTEIIIQDIVRTDDQNVILKIKLPPNLNKEEVYKQLESEYNTLKEEKLRLEGANKALVDRNDDLMNKILGKSVEKAKETINNYYIHQEGNFGLGFNQGEIAGNSEIGAITNEAEEPNLTEVAAQIQALLEQLSQTYLTNTVKEKMIIAGEVVEEIEKNAHLTQRLLSAAKVGSLAAIELRLNHPAASFVIAALEDLKKNKNEL